MSHSGQLSFFGERVDRNHLHNILTQVRFVGNQICCIFWSTFWYIKCVYIYESVEGGGILFVWGAADGVNCEQEKNLTNGAKWDTCVCKDLLWLKPQHSIFQNS